MTLQDSSPLGTFRSPEGANAHDFARPKAASTVTEIVCRWMHGGAVLATIRCDRRLAERARPQGGGWRARGTRWLACGRKHCAPGDGPLTLRIGPRVVQVDHRARECSGTHALNAQTTFLDFQRVRRLSAGRRSTLCPMRQWSRLPAPSRRHRARQQSVSPPRKP
jgi:hypothetical protein